MTRGGCIAAAGVAVSLLLLPLAFAPVLAHMGLVLMKVDLMAFGGGWTSLSLLQREVVDRLGWVTSREFIDGIALGQVTPGPILITATFVGYKIGGFLGAILGTIAIFFPSFLIVTTLAPHYDRIRQRRSIQVMVRGVLAAFIGMLLVVAYGFAREALVDWRTWSLLAAAGIALWRRMDPLVLMGAGAALSVLIF